MKNNNLKSQQGFTLIELMIAVVLGLFITGGMIQLFTNSQQSYRIQENMSRLQENGRFAMHFITQDVRMADFWGCLNTTKDVENNLNADANFDAFVTSLNGVDNDADAGNNIVDGTDTITIKGAFGSGVSVIADPATVTADLTVAANSSLNQYDLVLVTDCLDGDIFQINDNPSGGNVVHNTTAIPANVAGPGNADSSLQKKYGTDSLLFKLNFATYSIQDGVSGQPALFRSVNGGTSQELIEGIEGMQILYGEDTDNDKTPNYYLAAGSAGLDMDKVVSVRISLLIKTLEDNLATQAIPYTIFGVTTTPGDRAIRRVFTSTIAIRNRLP